MVKDKHITRNTLLLISDDELYEWSKKYLFLSAVESKSKSEYSATCEMIKLEARRRNKFHIFENAVNVMKAQQMTQGERFA